MYTEVGHTPNNLQRKPNSSSTLSSGTVKGIVSDSNNIFVWHESKHINKKGYFQKFSWLQFHVYKLCMIMCTDIAP